MRCRAERKLLDIKLLNINPCCYSPCILLFANAGLFGWFWIFNSLLLFPTQVFDLMPGMDSARMWREVTLMRQCSHPRILPLLGVAIKVILRGVQVVVGGEVLSSRAEASRRQKGTHAAAHPKVSSARR